MDLLQCTYSLVEEYLSYFQLIATINKVAKAFNISVYEAISVHFFWVNGIKVALPYHRVYILLYKKLPTYIPELLCHFCIRTSAVCEL